jgi:hypothetical protein
MLGGVFPFKEPIVQFLKLLKMKKPLFYLFLYFLIEVTINSSFLNFLISNLVFWTFWNQKTYQFQIFKPPQFIIGLVISLLGNMQLYAMVFKSKKPNLILYAYC